MTYPSISENRAVQRAYERMRQNGQSHNMAEMLALRKIPACRTNATLLAAVNSDKEQWSFSQPNMHSKAVVESANKLGVHPKQYQPEWADYAGDPKAFLPNDDPGGHLKKLKRRQKEKETRLVEQSNE